MSRNNDQRVLHLRSNKNVDGAPKLPSADDLKYGEIAINYGDGLETLTIKNSGNEVVTFSNDESFDMSVSSNETNGYTVTAGNRGKSASVNIPIADSTKAGVMSADQVASLNSKAASLKFNASTNQFTLKDAYGNTLSTVQTSIIGEDAVVATTTSVGLYTPNNEHKVLELTGATSSAAGVMTAAQAAKLAGAASEETVDNMCVGGLSGMVEGEGYVLKNNNGEQLGEAIPFASSSNDGLMTKEQALKLSNFDNLAKLYNIGIYITDNGVSADDYEAFSDILSEVETKSAYLVYKGTPLVRLNNEGNVTNLCFLGYNEASAKHIWKNIAVSKTLVGGYYPATFTEEEIASGGGTAEGLPLYNLGSLLSGDTMTSEQYDEFLVLYNKFSANEAYVVFNSSPAITCDSSAAGYEMGFVALNNAKFGCHYITVSFDASSDGTHVITKQYTAMATEAELNNKADSEDVPNAASATTTAVSVKHDNTTLFDLPVASSSQAGVMSAEQVTDLSQLKLKSLSDSIVVGEYGIDFKNLNGDVVAYIPYANNLFSGAMSSAQAAKLAGAANESDVIKSGGVNYRTDGVDFVTNANNLLLALTPATTTQAGVMSATQAEKLENTLTVYDLSFMDNIENTEEDFAKFEEIYTEISYGKATGLWAYRQPLIGYKSDDTSYTLYFSFYDAIYGTENKQHVTVVTLNKTDYSREESHIDIAADADVPNASSATTTAVSVKHGDTALFNLPVASSSQAGVMTAAQFEKLDSTLPVYDLSFLISADYITAEQYAIVVSAVSKIVESQAVAICERHLSNDASNSGDNITLNFMTNDSGTTAEIMEFTINKTEEADGAYAGMHQVSQSNSSLAMESVVPNAVFYGSDHVKFRHTVSGGATTELFSVSAASPTLGAGVMSVAQAEKLANAADALTVPYDVTSDTTQMNIINSDGSMLFPLSAATTTTAGVMSAAQATKLESAASVNSVPNGANSTENSVYFINSSNTLLFDLPMASVTEAGAMSAEQVASLNSKAASLEFNASTNQFTLKDADGNTLSTVQASIIGEDAVVATTTSVDLYTPDEHKVLTLSAATESAAGVMTAAQATKLENTKPVYDFSNLLDNDSMSDMDYAIFTGYIARVQTNEILGYYNEQPLIGVTMSNSAYILNFSATAGYNTHVINYFSVNIESTSGYHTVSGDIIIMATNTEIPTNYAQGTDNESIIIQNYNGLNVRNLFTIQAATSSTAGVMSAAQAAKLENVPYNLTNLLSETSLSENDYNSLVEMYNNISVGLNSAHFNGIPLLDASEDNNYYTFKFIGGVTDGGIDVYTYKVEKTASAGSYAVISTSVKTSVYQSESINFSDSETVKITLNPRDQAIVINNVVGYNVKSVTLSSDGSSSTVTYYVTGDTLTLGDYNVISGSITYSGSTYNRGDTFTVASGGATSFTGTGVVASANSFSFTVGAFAPVTWTIQSRMDTGPAAIGFSYVIQ